MAGKKDKVKDSDRFTIITPGFTGRCFICNSNDRVAKHEAFGGPNRDKSKQYGLVYELCGPHHNLSNIGVHFDKDLDLKLKKHAEKIWIMANTDDNIPYEERINKFIEVFHKNYIEDIGELF